MSTKGTAGNARETARILHEAIEATGGPAGPSLASVRVYIDRRHAGFPWAGDWTGQIEGAKAALRSRLKLAAPASDDASNAPKPARLEAGDLDRARQIVEHAADGDVDQASRLLEIADELGGIDRARHVLSAWTELLAAVDGHAGRAERALQVITRHLAPASFPRLARGTIESKAA